MKNETVKDMANRMFQEIDKSNTENLLPGTIVDMVEDELFTMDWSIMCASCIPGSIDGGMEPSLEFDDGQVQVVYNCIYCGGEECE